MKQYTELRSAFCLLVVHDEHWTLIYRRLKPKSVKVYSTDSTSLLFKFIDADILNSNPLKYLKIDYLFPYKLAPTLRVESGYSGWVWRLNSEMWNLVNL